MLHLGDMPSTYHLTGSAIPTGTPEAARRLRTACGHSCRWRGQRRVVRLHPLAELLERSPRGTQLRTSPGASGSANNRRRRRACSQAVSRRVARHSPGTPRNPKRPLSHHLPLRRLARKEAGIEDMRIHDLRHRYASHAVLQGVPLPVVSRLLGHKQPSMTLRYAHVSDRETEAAAERIGVVIARALCCGEASSGD